MNIRWLHDSLRLCFPLLLGAYAGMASATPTSAVSGRAFQ